MGVFVNGNQFDVQSVSGTAIPVVNGLNIGYASTATFTIPLNFHLQTKTFDVVSSDTSCTVTPASTVTLNGGAGALTVAALTGKTFYATAANTWISF